MQQYLVSLISLTLFITRLQVIFIFGIKFPFKRWSEEGKCQEVKVTSEADAKRKVFDIQVGLRRKTEWGIFQRRDLPSLSERDLNRK